MARCYNIPKMVVMEAFSSVKANGGAAGSDGQDIKAFEANLKSELYKIWNRMSSGSYFPPPIRAVDIPKKKGGKRVLGIPTVGDRVAQTVVKMHLEARLEEVFHTSSFGYRPGRSAHDAVEQAKRNCWKSDWVIDLDIKGFFDNLDHELMMKALKRHVREEWMLIYVERWLKAPLETKAGVVISREKGTPQGGVISPLLANLFLHYAFDMWMRREFPDIAFERYADDIVVHCRTEKAAKYVHDRIVQRLRRCKLELHPEKTKIVLVKEKRWHSKRKVSVFDFLGFTFRPRMAKRKDGSLFTSVLPAISKDSANSIRDQIRDWKIHLHTSASLEDIALYINPVVRGWIQYYGAFYKTELRKPLKQLEARLVMWARRKYKLLRFSQARACGFLAAVAKRNPSLFAHWKFGVYSSVGK